MTPAEKKLVEEHKKRLGVEAIIADWDAEERDKIRAKIIRESERRLKRARDAAEGSGPAQKEEGSEKPLE